MELVEYNGDPGTTLGDVQRALSAWFPASTHPGGLAWEAATDQLPERLAVVSSVGDVVGWAACSSDDARVECHPDDTATTDLLTAWLLDTAGDQPLSVAVHHPQKRLREFLALRGFVDEELPLAGISHPATDTGARAPTGYRIRPVADGEDTLRLEAHRKAWKPAAMPYSDDILSQIDPHAESRLDEAGLARMQASRLYRRDLDLVIEAPDGSLAGNCTVWLDPASGWAELEPLGIVPEHRRRGLAQVLALDVCRRVGEHGGSAVFINSAPFPSYPAPYYAYVKAGFTPMNRGARMRSTGTNPGT